MTKRAGKRKRRRSNRPPGRKSAGARAERGPAVRHGATGSPVGSDGLPATAHEDHLPERESQRLEIRAVAQGWLLEGEESGRLRQQLMLKMAQIAGKSPDEKTAVAAFRALTTAELRQQAVRVGALARSELPAQVNVQVNTGNAASSEAEAPAVRPFEVVQGLLRRNDVRNALRGVAADQAANG